MPKLTKQCPSYRLHRKSGQAVVTLDGRDFYLGPYGTKASRLEYDRLIVEWLANGRRLAVPTGRVENTALTINEFLMRYLQFAQGFYVKNGKPTSEIGCINLAITPLQELYGRLPVGEFSPLKLKAVRDRMIAADISRGVVNQSISRIKRAFRWGAENELVPPTVYHGLQAVRGLAKGRSNARETDPVKPVPNAHVDAIEPFVSAQVWAMVQLQRITGMRPGEARTMRGCDLDMSGSLWEYRPVGHKTEHRDKQRVIPLGPRSQSLIRPFLKADLMAHLFDPRDAETSRNLKRRRNRNTPMTPSQRNRKPKGRRINAYYTKDSYITAIQRACEKASAPSWHPNQLRHTSGTQIRKECGLEAAQVWLGHSRADVTQIYAERNLELARQIAAKYG